MALSRDHIVRTALDLLDDTGLDGLTLRLLADRLGVKAPAMYWHFASKADLLDEMATTMLRDLLASSGPPPSNWRAMMTGSAVALRDMMLARRDGARVFAGTYITDDSTVASTEAPLRVLTDAGFSLDDAVMAWQTMYHYVVGSAIEEQGIHGPAGELDPRFDPSRRRARIDADDAPLAHAASDPMFGDADARFAFGMRTIIAGLDGLLAG